MDTRLLTPDDLASAAALHLASWRATYGDVLPADYLGAALERDVAAQWRALSPDDLCLGFFDGAAMQGLAAYRMRPDGAYLDNFHVGPDLHRRGVGRALFLAGAQALVGQGVSHLWLTVLVRNRTARDFYAAMGGAEASEIEDAMFGHPVRALPVHWPDLRATLAKLEP